MASEPVAASAARGAADASGGGRLAGRVALITGAARGQGAEEARLFAREGARVAIADLLAEEAAALAREIDAQLGPGRALALPLDVTDEAQWVAAVAATLARFGRLDVLVNNAAVHWRAPLEQETAAGFDRMLAVNARGPFLGIRACAPAIREAGGGAIVNVASTAGMTGYRELGAYGASKWALRGLTRVAALELAPDGIRVNALVPGGVRTAMVPDPDAPGRWDHLPAARVGEPAEIARAALFLACDDSAYMTGTDLVVDGGALAG